MYSAACGRHNRVTASAGDEAAPHELLLITKDRTEASYYSLGHSTGGRERGASGETALYMGQTATYSLGPSGGIVHASVDAAAGLRQVSPFVPPPGHVSSIYENDADAPSDSSFNRVIRANVKHRGDVFVSDAVGLGDMEGAHARLLAVVEGALSGASSGAASLAPAFLARDARGEPFSFHGRALLAAGRRGLAGSHEGGAARRQLLTAGSLLVDLTPAFRAGMKASIAGSHKGESDVDERDLRLLAGTRTDTMTQSREEGTGATVLEYLRTSSAGQTQPFFLDPAAGGAGQAREDAREEEEDAQEQDAHCAHNALLNALACLPAYMYDDAQAPGKMADSSYMPCMQALANATRVSPDILVAAHRLLLKNPCVNPYAGAAAVLAHPGLASKHAQAFADAGERTAARWAADVDGTACDAPAVLSTHLSHRLVELLITMIVSATDPDAVHSEAALMHMLLQPDAYRYPTVLEAALQTLVSYDSPSETVVEAALHVAYHIEDGETEQRVHESETWSLALLSAGAVLHKARAFHDGGRPTWDVAGVMEALHVESGNARAAAYEERLAAILRGRGGPAYDADYHEGRFVSYVLSRLQPAMRLHEKEAGHRQLAMETALLVWPTLPQSQRVHYLSQAEGVPERDMTVLLSLDEEAGSYSTAEAAHLDVRGIAALRDRLLQESRGSPAALEPLRFGLAQKMMKALGGNASWNQSHAESMHAARLLAARNLACQRARAGQHERGRAGPLGQARIRAGQPAAGDHSSSQQFVKPSTHGAAAQRGRPCAHHGHCRGDSRPEGLHVRVEEPHAGRRAGAGRGLLFHFFYCYERHDRA